MMLPRRLRVGRATYRVRSRRLRGLYGETDFDAATISIARDASPAARASTLAHEALHALFHASGLCADSEIARLEERIVAGLETPFAAFIADNPSFVAFLRENLR